MLQEAGAVPKQLVWDNESGIGQGRLTEPAAAFAGVLGCEIRRGWLLSVLQRKEPLLLQRFEGC